MIQFSYDVFISFASADNALAQPIWEKLTVGGLRVFLADLNLIDAAGESWFKKITDALLASKHLLLVCTEKAMVSAWVQKECELFFQLCHIKNQDTRRIIPYFTPGFPPERLFSYLQTIQGCTSIEKIIPKLGGTDIKAILDENALLKRQITVIQEQLNRLQNQGITSQTQQKEPAVVKETQKAAVKTPARGATAVSHKSFLSDPAVNEDVMVALGKVVSDITSYQSMYGGGNVVKDENSRKIWQELYKATRGRETTELCIILDDLGKKVGSDNAAWTRNRQEWNLRWRALVFLSYSCATLDSKPYLALIPVYLKECLLTEDQLTRNPAIELFKRLPLLPDEKWTFLHSIIDPAIGAQGGALLSLLAQYANSDAAKEQTAELFYGMLESAIDPALNAPLVSALPRFKPHVRVQSLVDILLFGDESLCEEICKVLPELADRTVIPAMLGLMERFSIYTRHSFPQQVCNAIYKLGGDDSISGLSALFERSPSALQRSLLKSASPFLKHNDFRSAVERVKLSTSDKTLVAEIEAMYK